MTTAPSRANFVAVARPMPWAAPVMMQILSFSLMVGGLLVRFGAITGLSDG